MRQQKDGHIPSRLPLGKAFMMQPNTETAHISPEALKNLQSTLSIVRKNTLDDGQYFEMVIEPIFNSDAFNQKKDDILKQLNEKGTLKGFDFGEDIEKQLRIAGVSVDEFSVQATNLYKSAKNVLIVILNTK